MSRRHAAEIHDSASEVDTSSTTSSSASDITGIGEELDDLPPLDKAADEMGWFKQGSKTHLIKGQDDTHRMVPWCRDSAFLQDPRQAGVGFGTCTKSTFCKRCLARLPRGAYIALADLCGCLH